MSQAKVTKRTKFLDNFVMGESKHESQRHILDPNELEVPCVIIVDVEVAQSPSRRIGHMVDNCASDGLTTAGVGFSRGLGRNSAQFDASEPVFGACGAAALYRRRVLDEIGFLDEDFFLYDEDTDLNFRGQLAGWKCIYIPLKGTTFQFQIRITAYCNAT